MTEYRKSGPNLIESPEGSIRITGRAGIDVEFRGEHVRVNSEMLAEPMSVVIYRRGVNAIESERPEEVLDYVVRGLEFAGFRVDLM